MEFALLAAMYIILCIVCGFIAFLSGFLLGKGRENKTEPRAQPELTEADKVKLERWQREYDNFMKFDGSQQE